VEGEFPFDPGTEPVSSDKKYEVLTGEADGYYKMVVSVSTAFLGGSILFLEKIAPRPLLWTMVVLAMGWMALLIAIHLIIDVRRKNLESLRHAMEGDYDQARAIDAQTRAASKKAQWGMLCGMALVGVYGFTNLAIRKDVPTSPQRVILEAGKTIPLALTDSSELRIRSSQSNVPLPGKATSRGGRTMRGTR